MRRAFAALPLLALTLANACDRKAEHAGSLEDPPGLPERTAEPQGMPQQNLQGQQGMPGQPPGAPSEAGELQVSDSEVEKFSAAQLKLASLQGALQAEVKQGKEPSVAQQDYQQQAGQVVANSGLSFERYQAIAQRIADDPQLKARVEQRLAPPTPGAPSPAAPP